MHSHQSMSPLLCAHKLLSIAFSYVLEFVEAVGNGSGAVETAWQREGGDGESVEV